MISDFVRRPHGRFRFLRTATFALLAMAALLARTWGQTIEERKKTPLSPATEQAFAEYAENIRPIKEKQLMEDMGQLIDQIAAKVALTQEERTRLTQAAHDLCAAASRQWKQRLIEGLRPNYASVAPKVVKRLLENIPPPLGYPVENLVLPQENPEWDKKLAAILGSERYATWLPQQTALRNDKAKQISDYLNGWAEQAHIPFQQALKDEIEERKTVLKLSETQVHNLEHAAEQEVDRVTKEQINRGSRILKSLNDQHRKEMLGGTFRILFDCPQNLEEDVAWTKSVAQLLTPAELTTWSTYKQEEHQKDIAEWTKTLASQADQAKETVDLALERDIRQINSSGQLSPAKLDTLSKSAHTVAQSFADEWARRALKLVERMSPQMRASILQGNGSYPTGQQGEGDPPTIPAWTEAVDQILSPEEKQRWHAAAADLELREIQSLSSLFIVEMDRRVAFSGDQRTALEPLAEKVVRKQMAMYTNMEYTLGGMSIPTWASQIPRDKLDSILTPMQRTAWDSVIKNFDHRRTGRNYTPVPWTPPSPASPDPFRKPEPESVENTISQYLYHLLSQERIHRLEQIQPVVDQVTRVTSLSPEDSKRLQTAAQGAVEASLTSWLMMMHNNLDSILHDATPESIRTRIEALGSWNFSQPDQSPEQQPIWQDFISAILAGNKKQLWDKERKEQEEYRLHALSRWAVTTLRRQCSGITAEMADRLEPRVVQVLTDYGTDIDNYFSTPWYLTSYARTLPLAGIPENEMIAIMGPEALKEAKEAALNQASAYWSGIQQNHENRAGNHRNP